MNLFNKVKNTITQLISDCYYLVLVSLPFILFVVFISYESKTSAIFKAIENENSERVRSLLEDDPSLATIIKSENKGDYTYNSTPLIEVNRNAIIAKLLLSNGADPLRKDSNGRSALMKSIEYKKYKLTELYLKHLKSKNVNIQKIRFRSRFTNIYDPCRSIGMGEYDEAPLIHFALKESDKAMVELLLKNGVDPNEKSKLGFSVLHYFAEERSDYPSEILKLLLKYIDVKNDPPIGPDGVRPIHLAAYNRNFEEFKVLIRIGHSPYDLTSHMHSALNFVDMECIEGRELIKWLQNQKTALGIDPNKGNATFLITLESFLYLKDEFDGLAIKFFGKIKDFAPMIKLQEKVITINISKTGKKSLIDNFKKLSSNDQKKVIWFCLMNEIESMPTLFSETPDSKFWWYIRKTLVDEKK